MIKTVVVATLAAWIANRFGDKHIWVIEIESVLFGFAIGMAYLFGMSDHARSNAKRILQEAKAAEGNG